MTAAQLNLDKSANSKSLTGIHIGAMCLSLATTALAVILASVTSTSEVRAFGIKFAADASYTRSLGFYIALAALAQAVLVVLILSRARSPFKDNVLLHLANLASGATLVFLGLLRQGVLPVPQGGNSTLVLVVILLMALALTPMTALVHLAREDRFTDTSWSAAFAVALPTVMSIALATILLYIPLNIPMFELPESDAAVHFKTVIASLGIVAGIIAGVTVSLLAVVAVKGKPTFTGMVSAVATLASLAVLIPASSESFDPTGLSNPYLVMIIAGSAILAVLFGVSVHSPTKRNSSA